MPEGFKVANIMDAGNLSVETFFMIPFPKMIRIVMSGCWTVGWDPNSSSSHFPDEDTLFPTIPETPAHLGLLTAGALQHKWPDS